MRVKRSRAEPEAALIFWRGCFSRRRQADWGGL